MQTGIQPGEQALLLNGTELQSHQKLTQIGYKADDLIVIERKSASTKYKIHSNKK